MRRGGIFYGHALRRISGVAFGGTDEERWSRRFDWRNQTKLIQLTPPRGARGRYAVVHLLELFSEEPEAFGGVGFGEEALAGVRIAD